MHLLDRNFDPTPSGLDQYSDTSFSVESRKELNKEVTHNLDVCFGPAAVAHNSTIQFWSQITGATTMGGGLCLSHSTIIPTLIYGRARRRMTSMRSPGTTTSAAAPAGEGSGPHFVSPSMLLSLGGGLVEIRTSPPTLIPGGDPDPEASF